MKTERLYIDHRIPWGVKSIWDTGMWVAEFPFVKFRYGYLYFCKIIS